MRHDETRDNCTNLEATLIAADAFEETREDEGSDGTTWHECGCEDCSTVPFANMVADPSLGSRRLALKCRPSIWQNSTDRAACKGVSSPINGVGPTR